MELKITGAEFAYSVLQSAHLFRETPEDANRAESQNLEKLKRATGFPYSPIQLDEPLGRTHMVVARSDATYKAFIIVSATGPVFDKISPQLIDVYRESGKDFKPTSNHGTGRLLDAKGQPYVGIISGSDDRNIIDIGIGCNGAFPRKFENAGDMAMEFGDLEEAVNLYLNSVYNNLVNLGRLEKVPEGAFYLNP